MHEQWKLDLTVDIRDHLDSDENDGSAKWCSVECSGADKAALLEHFMKIKDRCEAILEIGVNRNGEESFTQVLLRNKLPSTRYLGVDLDDKTYLNNEQNRIYTIIENSSNTDKIMSYAESVGIKKFDFILIDGNHSINQVLRDWEFTKYLADGGIVAFHDTAYHYGPNRFINKLNPERWHAIPNAVAHADDYGMGFAWRK